MSEPTPAPQGAAPRGAMPDPVKEPEAFYAWAITEEGQAYFQQLNVALMERGVVAPTVGMTKPDRASDPAAPGATAT